MMFSSKFGCFLAIVLTIIATCSTNGQSNPPEPGQRDLNGGLLDNSPSTDGLTSPNQYRKPDLESPKTDPILPNQGTSALDTMQGDQPPEPGQGNLEGGLNNSPQTDGLTSPNSYHKPDLESPKTDGLTSPNSYHKPDADSPKTDGITSPNPHLKPDLESPKTDGITSPNHASTSLDTMQGDQPPEPGQGNFEGGLNNSPQTDGITSPNSYHKPDLESPKTDGLTSPNSYHKPGVDSPRTDPILPNQGTSLLDSMQGDQPPEAGHGNYNGGLLDSPRTDGLTFESPKTDGLISPNPYRKPDLESPKTDGILPYNNENHGHGLSSPKTDGLTLYDNRNRNDCFDSYRNDEYRKPDLDSSRDNQYRRPDLDSSRDNQYRRPDLDSSRDNQYRKPVLEPTTVDIPINHNNRYARSVHSKSPSLDMMLGDDPNPIEPGQNILRGQSNRLDGTVDIPIAPGDRNSYNKPKPFDSSNGVNIPINDRRPFDSSNGVNIPINNRRTSDLNGVDIPINDRRPFDSPSTDRVVPINNRRPFDSSNGVNIPINNRRPSDSSNGVNIPINDRRPFDSPSTDRVVPISDSRPFDSSNGVNIPINNRRPFDSPSTDRVILNDRRPLDSPSTDRVVLNDRRPLDSPSTDRVVFNDRRPLDSPSTDRVVFNDRRPLDSPSTDGMTYFDRERPYWRCDMTREDQCQLVNRANFVQFKRGQYLNEPSLILDIADAIRVRQSLQRLNPVKSYNAGRLATRDYFPTNNNRVACLHFSYAWSGSEDKRMHLIQRNRDDKCIYSSHSNGINDRNGQWRDVELQLDLTQGDSAFLIEFSFDMPNNENQYHRPRPYPIDSYTNQDSIIAIRDFKIGYGYCRNNQAMECDLPV